jgi:hypothetical protein
MLDFRNTLARLDNGLMLQKYQSYSFIVPVSWRRAWEDRLSQSVFILLLVLFCSYFCIEMLDFRNTLARLDNGLMLQKYQSY